MWWTKWKWRTDPAAPCLPEVLDGSSTDLESPLSFATHWLFDPEQLVFTRVQLSPFKGRSNIADL